jgi:RHS repeat-associated protein
MIHHAVHNQTTNTTALRRGVQRYGFQAQEKDKELWEGAISFKYRVEDARLGRFFSVDPLAASFAWNSPYAFSENSVIGFIELEGLETAKPPLHVERAALYITKIEVFVSGVLQPEGTATSYGPSGRSVYKGDIASGKVSTVNISIQNDPRAPHAETITRSFSYLSVKKETSPAVSVSHMPTGTFTEAYFSSALSELLEDDTKEADIVGKGGSVVTKVTFDFKSPGDISEKEREAINSLYGDTKKKIKEHFGDQAKVKINFIENAGIPHARLDSTTDREIHTVDETDPYASEYEKSSPYEP